MRDPARIDRMIELLRQRWHENPDQRLGQLVTNFCTIHLHALPFNEHLAVGTRPWLTEDDVTETNLRKGLTPNETIRNRN